MEESESLGLHLNSSKSEIIVLGGSPEEKENIRLRFEQCAPGIRTVSAEEVTLLGSPLAEKGLEPEILEKVDALKRLRDSLMHVGMHSGLFLLKN